MIAKLRLDCSADKIGNVMLQTLNPATDATLDKFRLRNFVDRLVEIGEVVVHNEPIALNGLSAAIAATPKGVLFRDAGAEHFEIVAAVAGSRRRLATAFGVDERQV